jgi:hypothetical protein
MGLLEIEKSMSLAVVCHVFTVPCITFQSKRV